jgi:hypothetical protein
MNCHVTPSTGMALIYAMFVLLHANMQPERMDVGWMDALYASMMCLNAMMLTTQCFIFIISIMVMGMHELLTIIIDQYNYNKNELVQ